MKKYLPLLILLVSCAGPTTSNYRKGAAEEATMPEEDYSWVDQLNFDKKSETKYQPQSDEFSMGSEEATHALVKESLFALPAAKLEEAFGKTTDVLSKINIRCYQNKFDEAFKMADDIYGQYKSNTSYWNQLGTCYYLKADYAKAFLFYNKSRDLDPKFAPPINNLGVVYIKQGKFQKALAAFKKASDISTFGVTPNFNLAWLYLRFGTVGKALPILQGLQKKSPQDVEVNSALATAYLLKGDFSKAISIYSTFNKETLSHASIGLNYAVALKFENRPVDAQTVYSNVAQSTDVELKEYSEKVQKFIRN